MITVFLFAGGFNGYYVSFIQSCSFNLKNLDDVEYVFSSWFNKAEFLQFNSTVGEFVGYTAFGVRNAEQYNKDQGYLAQMRSAKDQICRNNIRTDMDAILTKTGESD